MDYTIKSGDNLWNIVRNNYKCENNSEINDRIKQIIQDNDLGDGNLIFKGQQISLPDDEFSIQNANRLEDWAKFSDSDDVEDFEMFDYEWQPNENFEQYSKDIENFSKNVIKKYDEDGDGEMNKSEYTNFHKALKGHDDTIDKAFDNMNINADNDKNDKTINAQELASNFAEADYDVYYANGGKTPGFMKDGKLSSNKLNKLLNEPDNYITTAVKSFFDNHYKKD